MGNGYERIYHTILPKLGECDILQNGVRLGAEPVEGGVRVCFLGRNFIIGKEGVEPEDKLDASVNSLSVLIYYITSNGAGDFSYDFAPLNRLAGMIDGQTSLTNGTMSVPLIREFGEHYDRFAMAVARLGGVEQAASDSGKHIWRLLALPKILTEIIFYEADDEFPADIQIMLDRTAPRFLDFECLAVMTGAMINELIRQGRED
jgi:hypothetical protein